jgi:hypothetical protein
VLDRDLLGRHVREHLVARAEADARDAVQAHHGNAVRAEHPAAELRLFAEQARIGRLAGPQERVILRQQPRRVVLLRRVHQAAP